MSGGVASPKSTSFAKPGASDKEESKAGSGSKKGSDEGEGSDEDDDDDDDDSDEDDCIIRQEDMIFNPSSGLRNWLKSRGKEHYIDFEDEELR